MTALNAARRAADLSALAEGAELDVLVIGGGITGAGVALDAASRGLRVALVEKHDLAFGTSRWSSTLVHGGLRYLATGNVGIARRSALERGILMTRTAPHLVRAMPLSNAQKLAGNFAKVSMAPQVLFIANVTGRTNTETEKFVEYLSTEKAAKLFFSNGFEMVSTQAQAGKK